jgi:hypothetical protein
VLPVSIILPLQTLHNWWDKLEPIFSILRQKYSHYWIPSVNLTIDEIILKFKGRTV